MSTATMEDETTYLSCVEISVNLVLRVVPIELTVAMITTEMPAAMRPYSIAVAPVASYRQRSAALCSICFAVSS
jgi:hypothetical protein